MDVSLFLPIFKAFNESGIKYVVVGGIAVVLHGFPRITGDIDLILDLDEKNCLACMELLERLGFRPKVPVKIADFANSALRNEWIDEKGMKAFALYTERPMHLEVDILIRNPDDFEELRSRSVLKSANGVDIRIASIDDLIDLKLEAGRNKDLEDIEALKLIKANANE